jgi:hypothetical protein
LFHARPHPDLLPREEGTAFARFAFSAGRPANPVARIFKPTANGSPSPWGEGRDEGGRKTKKTCRTEMHQKTGLMLMDFGRRLAQLAQKKFYETKNSSNGVCGASVRGRKCAGEQRQQWQ